MEHVKYKEMVLLHQTPNFKLPQQQILEFHNLIADYSTHDLLLGKQSSDKLQTSNFKKFWCLVFEISLVFGVWFLNFVSEGDD